MQNIDDVKRHLQQIKRLDSKIRMLRDTLNEIRQQMSGIKSPSYDADKVQMSARDDKLLKLISRYEDTDARLVRAISESMQARERILREIDEVDNDSQRQVLYYRYVKQMKWDDIADEMHYSRRRVEQIHGNALLAFRIISQKYVL